MRTESIADSVTGDISSRGRLGHQFARRTILRWLEKLEFGQLKLIDGEEVYLFGDTSASPELSATILVEDPELYATVLVNGSIGAGEAYIEQMWRTPDLVKVIRLMAVNLESMHSLDRDRSLLKRSALWLMERMRRNSLVGSRKNISAHYDLGNDFFSLFLDPEMVYSAAIYRDDNQSLEDAAVNKLDTVCQKLDLKPSDHLLEIGTGWGGLACYAAINYGCRVTTTTISREQYEYACEKVSALGLEERVEVLFKDYRELTGSYDKLVSIEMIEAVGHQYYDQFFQVCQARLKQGGLMLIQAITISDQRFHQYRDRTDFIRQYIFPGGCLPSVSVIAEHVARNTDAQIVDLHDITHDYALTLNDWKLRFLEHSDHLREQGYEDRFLRLWEYYLAYCEGGFRERIIQTSQIVIARSGSRFDRVSRNS